MIRAIQPNLAPPPPNGVSRKSPASDNLAHGTVPKVIIFAPLPLESNAVRRALCAVAETPTASWELHTIGLRASALPSIRAHAFKLVILVGIAGGLDPKLRIGDVVINASPSILLSDVIARHNAANPATRFILGDIHASSTPITTTTEKARLFEQVGKAAVDMESDRVRNWASQCGVPFVIVRGISDTANDALDPAILGFIDQSGRLKPWSIVSALFRNPLLLRHLFVLSRNSRRAAESAAAMVLTILNEAKWRERILP